MIRSKTDWKDYQKLLTVVCNVCLVQCCAFQCRELVKYSAKTLWCDKMVFALSWCFLTLISYCSCHHITFSTKAQEIEQNAISDNTLQHCDTQFHLLSSPMYKAVVLSCYGTWTFLMNVTGMYPSVRTFGFTSQI